MRRSAREEPQGRRQTAAKMETRRRSDEKANEKEKEWMSGARVRSEVEEERKGKEESSTTRVLSVRAREGDGASDACSMMNWRLVVECSQVGVDLTGERIINREQ